MTSSKDLFKKASDIFPGGVNSPVRAFKSVNRDPFFVEKAKDAYLYDVDGNKYIDYICSWGPLVLGHSHPKVVQAIIEQSNKGTSYGACSEKEIELAEIIQEFFPSMEMLRFVNSGTEAGMAVLRLAKGYTGKDKIIKFAGCYHGHADSLLAAAGSGVATFGIPDSKGVSENVVKNTLIAEYNNIDSVIKLYEKNKNEIAGIILEPVCGNAGFIPPQKGFLKELRKITEENNSLLIFDEVMTGFRVDLKGAQGLFNITPDLTMLGKVIGGGLPVGAYGGKKEIMQLISPSGPVYQAGTLSGNPLAMSSGIATLKEWGSSNNFELVKENTSKISKHFNNEAKRLNLDLYSESIGTMFGFFFSKEKVVNYSMAQESSDTSFIKFFNDMLDQGIFLAPSKFEAGFVSLAHNGDIIKNTLNCISNSLEKLKNEK
ncbi:UNVERIFIED_CONTAM: hypothetical protein GTU68_064426 [Idotea baltica]|nr:hypothetical protein [Idotea baltica]